MDAYVKCQIVENVEISKNIFQMVLSNKSGSVEPGQFYMLKCAEFNNFAPFLPRPISVSNCTPDTITFVYDVKGVGTEIFSKLAVGEQMEILGPLGNGFDLNLSGEIAIVGGGIGVAPLVYLAKMLNELKSDNSHKIEKIDFYAGFRDDIYLIDTIENYVDNVIIATESGRIGAKGYVVELVDTQEYDYILSCGPMPMMKALNNKCEHENIYLSVENRMACGIGACLGCSIKIAGEMKRVCVEGPVFKGKEWIYDN